MARCAGNVVWRPRLLWHTPRVRGCARVFGSLSFAGGIRRNVFAEFRRPQVLLHNCRRDVARLEHCIFAFVLFHVFLARRPRPFDEVRPAKRLPAVFS